MISERCVVPLLIPYWVQEGKIVLWSKKILVEKHSSITGHTGRRSEHLCSPRARSMKGALIRFLQLKCRTPSDLPLRSSRLIGRHRSDSSCLNSLTLRVLSLLRRALVHSAFAGYCHPQTRRDAVDGLASATTLRKHPPFPTSMVPLATIGSSLTPSAA